MLRCELKRIDQGRALCIVKALYTYHSLTHGSIIILKRKGKDKTPFLVLVWDRRPDGYDLDEMRRGPHCDGRNGRGDVIKEE